MKYTILLFLTMLFLFNHSALGQSDDFSTKQIKFYFNTINEGYQENKVSNNDIISKEISKIGVPSFAYAWYDSDKKWQEVEISTFFENNQGITISGNTVSSGFNERLAYFSVRYERNRVLLGSDKVDLSLGGSLQAFYLHNSFNPSTSIDFPFSYNGVHTKVAVIPRALIKFNRFALDFNTPFSVMHLNSILFREENPTLPQSFQSYGGISYLLFPNSYFLQARLGIVFDLK
jgi:hypothetical protein